MNAHENIEGRLWDYIDGVATVEEKTIIEQLIASNGKWCDKYGELLEVQQLLQSSELEAPLKSARARYAFINMSCDTSSASSRFLVNRSANVNT